VALCLLCSASFAAAQQQAKRTSAIVGVVMDSLHHKRLRGAEVMVEGVSAMTITDSLGLFRLDSLPAGTYQIGVFHPLLDSLGISLSTPRFSVGPDSTTLIRLAVPSAATLMADGCKARVRQFGRSAIFGRLMDPETLEPIANAEVSVVWNDYVASKAIGIRVTPRLVKDSTDSNGAFTLCGLPDQMDASLHAKYHGAMTADVPVATSALDGDFIIRPLYVSRSDTSAIKSGRAIVSGRVTFAAGQPASSSRVEIVGSSAVGITDERGEFTLATAPSGTQLLLVRHLGFTPEQIPVELTTRETRKVSVQLRKYIPMMDPVLVTARREHALESVGFTQRRRSGVGRYITADDIARHNYFSMVDALRRVPGLTTTRNAYGQDEIIPTRGASITGGACINYVVDGMRWIGGGVDDFVMPQEVAGIEVYSDVSVPAEFANPFHMGCTTIVIWTKLRTGLK